MTVLPVGTFLITDTSGLIDSGFVDRMKDVSFALQELLQMNESDPLLRGTMDLTRMGAIGHSWGGDVAREFALLEPRVKAAVLLDCCRCVGK